MPDGAKFVVAGLAALVGLVVPVVFALISVPERHVIGAFSVDGLGARFRDHGYNSDQVADNGTAVPRLYVSEFPRGWADLDPPARRKRLFIQVMLPLILRENQRIGAARARVAQLAAASRLSRTEARWLGRQAAEYGVTYGEWGKLLQRMDGIPPSLALVQGAIESGWGRSRFARQGNAVYGQWTQSRSGMTPRRRAPGATHKIRKFRNLGRSVAAYMNNINTHPAYESLRLLRAEARAVNRLPSGLELAGTLGDYSELGSGYIDMLKQVIGDERLERFDLARLEPQQD